MKYLLTPAQLFNIKQHVRLGIKPPEHQQNLARLKMERVEKTLIDVERAKNLAYGEADESLEMKESQLNMDGDEVRSFDEESENNINPDDVKQYERLANLALRNYKNGKG